MHNDTDNHHPADWSADWSAYRMHLTRCDIDHVLHYTHWIPNLRGFTTEFFATHYPGWDLPTFIKVFDAAGVRIHERIGAPHDGRCHWQLKCLHFNDVDSFAVESDDDITQDDGRFFWSGEPGATGHGAFTAEVEPEDIDDPEANNALAERILSELGTTGRQDGDAAPAE